MSTTTIPDALLDEASKVVASRLGLEFPPARWPDLERGLAAAARALGHADAASCMAWLCSCAPSQPQIETLAAHLTVAETYFFRDATTIAALEAYVLPELLYERRNERRLRIWSAGCATGEEPYTLAILLHRLLRGREGWNITILGSDIHASALETARDGIYGEWSFRAAPPWLKTGYFQPRGRKFELAEHIQRMVTFSYLNLAEDEYPSLASNTNAMDIVFCRNVLMYFSPRRARQVVEKLHRSLVEGGWLIVSPCEASASLLQGFSCLHWNGALLYRKVAQNAAPTPVVTPFRFEPIPPETPPADPLAELFTRPPQVASPVAAPAPPPPVETPYDRALRLYSVGDLVDARRELELLMASDGADAGAAVLLARVCANEGRLAEALAWCDRALAADKMQPSYHYLRAIVLAESGDGLESLAALQRALYLDQDFVMAHFTVGGLAQRLGRDRLAQRHRRAALALLARYDDEAIVPESEGMTARRLAQIVRHQEGPE